jgi:flagellar basal body L-ring protein FlgH
MKTIQYAAVAVMVMSLVAGVPAYAADDTVSQHETLAAQYEAKAAEQDALIAEHSPMNEKYEQRFWMIKKAAKPNNVVEMDKHCNTIVQNATGLRNELLEFAKWHRMRAAELQGQ